MINFFENQWKNNIWDENQWDISDVKTSPSPFNLQQNVGNIRKIDILSNEFNSTLNLRPNAVTRLQTVIGIFNNFGIFPISPPIDIIGGDNGLTIENDDNNPLNFNEIIQNTQDALQRANNVYNVINPLFVNSFRVRNMMNNPNGSGAPISILQNIANINALPNNINQLDAQKRFYDSIRETLEPFYGVTLEIQFMNANQTIRIRLINRLRRLIGNFPQDTFRLR